VDLSRFEGRLPRELLGGADFVRIGAEPYRLTLGPHAFYWLSLEPKRAEVTGAVVPAEEARPPAYVTATRRAEELLERKENWPTLERVLLNYIRDQRWFRGKSRRALSAAISDAIPIRGVKSAAYFVLVGLQYSEGEAETYVLPLALAPAGESERIKGDHPQAIVAYIEPKGSSSIEPRVLYDALVDRDVCSALLVAIGRRRSFRGRGGVMAARPTRSFRETIWPPETPLDSSPVKAEQTNTSVAYEDVFMLKIYRRLEEGVNPDQEIGRFLTEKAAFANVPPVTGVLEYRRDSEEPMSLGVLQGFVRNEGDAWRFTLESLQRYFENALAHPTVQIPPVPQKHVLSLSPGGTPLANETIGPYLASAHLLGERTAQLHMALAWAPEDPGFAPEPFTLMHQNSIYYSVRRSAIRAMQFLRGLTPEQRQEIGVDVERVLAQEGPIIDRLRLVRGKKMRAARIRCHGDYHLGQVLYTGKDFVIIDFEGEPARSLSERRLKRCPLRDVAGMMRSFHYAAHSALLRHSSAAQRPGDKPALEQWGRFWYTWVSVAFLSSYLDAMRPSGLLPADEEDLRILLDIYLLDKALYEVGYELNNRPDWVRVPLRGILDLLEVRE